MKKLSDHTIECSYSAKELTEILISKYGKKFDLEIIKINDNPSDNRVIINKEIPIGLVTNHLLN
jgi:hypothetical protein